MSGYYKKAAAFVLRAAVIDSGALEALVLCLEDGRKPEIVFNESGRGGLSSAPGKEFDPSVKESAAWALGYIARAHALSDISKHSPELAQVVVDAGAVTLLTKVDLAEVVVESEIFPTILHCLKDVDESVRKNAATCIRELSRHTPDLAKLIVNAGGIAAMVEFVNDARGNCRLPGIMTLGYVAAFSETLALAVVVSKGVRPLKDALISEPEDHVKAAAAWSLGQIGRHSPDHARALAEADVLRRMLAVYLHQDSSEDLQIKTKKSIIQKCTHLPALEPLIDSPPNILKYVIQQFAKVLPNDIDARRAFVQSGSLQKVQEVGAEAGSKLQDFIDSINMLYPPEIVQYYSPNYAEKLLTKMEEFNPS
ncbi:Spag6 [Symbiodinium pilosum]|uniref:Spag6 protein n=1 Tax=Symbiodinium pilosum TaxID=2952 RepID=A0A812Y0T9_SYMPI|nr:Spag6 [Symbiodinium pilosum]